LRYQFFISLTQPHLEFVVSSATATTTAPTQIPVQNKVSVISEVFSPTSFPEHGTAAAISPASRRGPPAAREQRSAALFNLNQVQVNQAKQAAQWPSSAAACTAQMGKSSRPTHVFPRQKPGRQPSHPNIPFHFNFSFQKS
jgi:hypothetical protein